ncbi:MAG: phosphopantetheine-binding protein [Deltaproteobacteria bacterium]|nr:phosphopantetheine-binding protein [Deltaproteobacteria bacterium]
MNSELMEEIEDIIRDVSGYEDDLEPEWDLIENRIIKSVMLLEIISEIEDEYDLDVTPQDVYDGHFASLKAMVKFVSRNT